MAPPRILLIGANGQVGWELLRSLRPLGTVIATMRKPSADSDMHALDVSDASAVQRLVREIRPTVIVNAAAYTAVDKAETEAELAATVNGRIPGVLAEEAKRCEALLVHYSTDYVFAGDGDRPWKEDDAVGPLGEYGRSKLAGEHAIAAVGGDYLILRTSWVYGIHGHNFVKTMLRLGAQREALKVVADQIGAPTSARAIAATTSLLIAAYQRQRAQNADLSGIYHLCCGGETSWHEFANEIFRLGREQSLPLIVNSVAAITTAEFPTPAKRPANSRMNCQKLADVFGLYPPDWKIALADSFALLSQQVAFT